MEFVVPAVRSATGAVPLREYAALGDGRTVALVARDGDIDWLPVPDLDTPPVFSALLDAERGGRIRLRPTAPFTVARDYLPETNVLRTVFRTSSGEVEVVDSLNSGVAGRLPWTELARRVTGLSGAVELEWSVEPGEQWRTRAPWLLGDEYRPVLRVGTVQLAVCGEGHGPVPDPAGVRGSFVSEPGSTHLVAVLGVDDQPVPLPEPREIVHRLGLTEQAWITWTGSCGRIGDLHPSAVRSALALKLLIHSPTATIAAAATTSLPEATDGSKNWDYRYSWLRDTSFTVSALQRLGVREEVHAATTRLLRTMIDDGPVPPVFTALDGGPPGGHDEAEIPGWNGIGPVSTGNDAVDQLQLGVFGDLFALVESYLAAGHVLDAASAEILSRMADTCCDLWRRPDAGIWELPQVRHYTSSKMGCHQALTVAAQLADQGVLAGDPRRWRYEAGEIETFVNARCWSESKGAYVFHADSHELDASVLLGLGLDSGDRMSRTIDALRTELGEGPWLYRYTGMRDEESCFVACSFWLVVALSKVGRRTEAQALLEQLRPQANDVGLWAEMIDPETGDFVGNLPQALSHLAHLDAELELRGR